MAFSLDSVTSSRGLYRPQRFLVYGVQGIGKSSFAATFADPIFLRTEDGTYALDVPTFPEVATSINDCVAAIQALHGEHGYRTLVVDSLDWLEPLVWQAVVVAHANDPVKVTNIEGIPYGKGYIEADNVWRMLQGGLDSLRFNRGMQVVLIAHSEIRAFTPPDSQPYDRYQPKLQRRAFALWQEWADNVFFVNYRTTVMARDQQARSFRAEGRGDRIVYTQERPSWLAKTRWELPAEIAVGQDRTWKPVHDALKAAIGDAYPQ